MASADESRKAAIEVVAYRTMAVGMRAIRMIPPPGADESVTATFNEVVAEIIRRTDQIDVTDEQYTAAYEYLFGEVQ